MRNATWVWPAIIGFIVGAGLGLLGGWVLWPAQYDQVTPNLLTEAHQDEYASMVAEAYVAGGDLELAREQLSRLGSEALTALRRLATQSQEANPAARLLNDLGVDLPVPDSTPSVK